MKKSDIAFLSQLYKSLDEASERMRDAHHNKDSEKFNQAKKVSIDLRLKIAKLLKDGRGKH